MLLNSIFFLLSIASTVNAAALFIFGDSLVDTGNNNYIIPHNRANSIPYGHNAFSGEPTGRFSDGRVIVDYIAEYAKLPLIPPFLQPSADFTHGANFASGGAVVLPLSDQETLVMDLPAQLNHFGDVQKLLRNKLGEEEAKDMIEEAVYLISIGSNDYMVNYLGNPQMQQKYNPEMYVSMVIANLTNAILDLYDKGARKFAILNLSPLGCIPTLRAMNPDVSGCFEAASALALAHNHALKTVLVNTLHRLKSIKFSNPEYSYNWLNNRIMNPSKYGFKDGVNACCGSGEYGGIYSCGDNATDFKLCDNANEYIWWDSYHPTQRIHEQFAKALWNQLPPPFGLRSYTLRHLFFENTRL
ncbi:GDSL lipase-like [Euphorbia lathyris]|uniref:GDSL lipase-like n=1 Tax=Euphorbia lathyris TaxID=212925 RepID=UPI0033143EC4